jgi:hypothetical protein
MSAWADRSEQIDLVAKALVACQTSLSDITKGRTANAGQYSYTYADLRDALATIRPVFASNGLAVTQTASAEEHDVVVWTTILHESGQFLTTQPVRFPVGKTIQQSGSAITYARRYALMAVCGLATEDDDGASAAPREPRRAERPSERPSERPAPASNDPRSAEEEQIRAILADLSASEAKAIRDEFRVKFGTTLSGLPAVDHGKALIWVTHRALGTAPSLSEA